MNHVFVISDGTGRTAQQALKAALTQFPDTSAEVHLHSEVRTQNQVLKIIEQAAKFKGFVVHTVVSKRLRQHVRRIGRLYNIETIDTDEGEKTGIALDEVIKSAFIGCIDCNDYTIKAKDGYQQTLSWNVIKTGVLTENKRVFFPDTAQSFWVRDVVEIEVK